MEKQKISEVLSLFSEGYRLRDQSNLDQFMSLFSDDDDLLVIGTNAVTPLDDEWCHGKAAVRELISSDWDHWGDVRFEFGEAVIQENENTAWVAATGSVSDTISADDTYEGFLSFANIMINNEEETRSNQKRMVEILALGNDLLLGLSLGETYTWPLRFTAVLVLEPDGKWRFKQMQFSFATTRPPDVRN